MNHGKMVACVGIKNLPNSAAKIGLQNHDVMPADSYHSRTRRRSRELEPIGGKPEFTYGMTEYPDRSATATKGPRRAALGMGNDLSLIPNMSIKMLDRQLARSPPLPDSPTRLANRGAKAQLP